MKKMNREGWNVTLDVIGPIKKESAYNEFKDNSDIRYIPKQSKEELIKYYRNADIFVMPSYHETFGLVYAEAMSQGLPVIYTRGQGFDKQFEDGAVGYAVSDTDSIELRQKIESVSLQYKELSKKALMSVQKFKWNLIC